MACGAMTAVNDQGNDNAPIRAKDNIRAGDFCACQSLGTRCETYRANSGIAHGAGLSGWLYELGHHATAFHTLMLITADHPHHLPWTMPWQALIALPSLLTRRNKSKSKLVAKWGDSIIFHDQVSVYRKLVLRRKQDVSGDHNVLVFLRPTASPKYSCDTMMSGVRARVGERQIRSGKLPKSSQRTRITYGVQRNVSPLTAPGEDANMKESASSLRTNGLLILQRSQDHFYTCKD